MKRDSPGAASLASVSLLVAPDWGLWARGDTEGESRKVKVNISILALPSNLKAGWEVAHIPVTVKLQPLESRCIRAWGELSSLMDTRCVFEHPASSADCLLLSLRFQQCWAFHCTPAVALPNFLDCVCACCSVLEWWNGRQQEWQRLNEQREEPELNFGRVISGASSSKQNKGVCFLLLSVWHWGNARQLPPDSSLIKRLLCVSSVIYEEVIN